MAGDTFVVMCQNIDLFIIKMFIYLGEYECTSLKDKIMHNCSVYFELKIAFKDIYLYKQASSDTLYDVIKDVPGCVYMVDSGFMPTYRSDYVDRVSGIEGNKFDKMSTQIASTALYSDNFKVSTAKNTKNLFEFSRVGNSMITLGERDYI